MKKIVVFALVLFGCSAQLQNLIWDAADASYVAAVAYYQVHKGDFSLDEAQKFEAFLTAYKLGLDSGRDVSGYAQRWYQCLQGY
jgi:hypothetical protein